MYIAIPITVGYHNVLQMCFKTYGIVIFKKLHK